MARKGRRVRGATLKSNATSAWEVKWHPDAKAEKDAIDDSSERVAIQHVIEKLEVDGIALRKEHQRAVMQSKPKPGGAKGP